MRRDYVALEADAVEAAGALAAVIPETVQAFFKLADVSLKKGALDMKTKELIALGIATAAPCEGCIAWHAKAAHKLGATRLEVADVIAVAIEMGGGPSVFNGIRALKAYDQFVAAASQQAARSGSAGR